MEEDEEDIFARSHDNIGYYEGDFMCPGLPTQKTKLIMQRCPRPACGKCDRGLTAQKPRMQSAMGWRMAELGGKPLLLTEFLKEQFPATHNGKVKQSKVVAGVGLR